MNAIISVLIKITLVISILLFNSSAEAQDYVNGQIDYAVNLQDDEALACLFPEQENEVTLQTVNKEVSVCIIPMQEEVILKEEKSEVTLPKTRQMYGRESITFILGKDANPNNPFYDKAFYYFANHPYDQTEFIITSCRSLLDVRNYLASYPTGNALPWSTINIVILPNEVEDLKVPIFPQGTKSNVENLKMVSVQNEFPSLSSNQIDERTRLYIHAAEVEENSKLNYALQELLFVKESVAIEPVYYFSKSGC